MSYTTLARRCRALPFAHKTGQAVVSGTAPVRGSALEAWEIERWTLSSFSFACSHRRANPLRVLPREMVDRIARFAHRDTYLASWSAGETPTRRPTAVDIGDLLNASELISGNADWWLGVHLCLSHIPIEPEHDPMQIVVSCATPPVPPSLLEAAANPLTGAEHVAAGSMEYDADVYDSEAEYGRWEDEDESNDEDESDDDHGFSLE